MEFVAELKCYATTVTAECGTKFHPAVQTPGMNPFYFENITFASEQEAYEHACSAVSDVWQAANAIAGQWNVVKL